MKQDLKTRLINRNVEKPNKFLSSIVMLALGALNKLYKVKFFYNFDLKSIKNQPTILLASHSARLEFIYAVYGFKRKDANIVCGYQNIMKKGLYGLLLKLGVISKYLYQPDFMCVKNILKVLKRNGSVILFPEGMQSTSGSTHPINPATAQLIKASKANIVVCTTKGAYLATNRYSSDRKKGHIEINYSLLFTPETLKGVSEQQIYEMLFEEIKYNDFEYNKVARNKYIGKKPNAYGINKILYKCPDCKSEHYLQVENDTIVCKNCNFKVQINEYYDIVPINAKNPPDDIDKWYKWQRQCVAEEIIDDNFKMQLKASLCTLKTDKLRKSPNNREILGDGTITINNRGITFSGLKLDQSINYDFDAQAVYSLTFSTDGLLEFYYKNEYFIIVPNKNETNLIKWTLASEEIHNLYDEKWKSACADAYNIRRYL